MENFGNHRHISCPDTPKQHGVTERKLDTLLRLDWLSYFIQSVVRINRLSSPILKMMTPFVKLYGE